MSVCCWKQYQHKSRRKKDLPRQLWDERVNPAAISPGCMPISQGWLPPWLGVIVLCLAHLRVCRGPSVVQWEAMDKRRKMGFIQWENFAPWQVPRQLLQVFSPCCFGLFSTGCSFLLNKSEGWSVQGKTWHEAQLNRAFIFSKMGKIS